MPSTTQAQQAPIPYFYRLIFNYIEPFFALSGAIQSLLFSESLIQMTTPNAHTSYTAGRGTLHPLMTQVSGGWLLLALNDIVTLRITRDRTIWACVLAAGLASDAIYTAALLEDLGKDWCRLGAWSVEIWATMLLTVLPLLGKVAFIAGIGLEGSPLRDVVRALRGDEKEKLK